MQWVVARHKAGELKTRSADDRAQDPTRRRRLDGQACERGDQCDRDGVTGQARVDIFRNAQPTRRGQFAVLHNSVTAGKARSDAS